MADQINANFIRSLNAAYFYGTIGVGSLALGSATLSSGAVVVSTTNVTANTIIILTTQSLGTVAAPKAIGVTARTAGTSFTITSADGTDTSVIGYLLIEPA